MTNLAGLLADRGELEEAADLSRMVTTEQKTALGPEHPDTLLTTYNLAALLADQSALEPSPRKAEAFGAEAEALGRQVEAAQIATLGEQHPAVLATRLNLAPLLHDRGDTDGAVARLQAVVAAQKEGHAGSRNEVQEMWAAALEHTEELLVRPWHQQNRPVLASLTHPTD
eukprot:SAG22_NODE_1281_length_4896_cov_2.097353_2_plen_170_part_00